MSAHTVLAATQSPATFVAAFGASMNLVMWSRTAPVSRKRGYYASVRSRS